MKASVPRARTVVAPAAAAAAPAARPLARIKAKAVAKPRIRPAAQAQQDQDQEMRRFPLPPVLPRLPPMPTPSPTPAPALVLTKEQCARWLANPSVNPLTGRMIKIYGETYSRLLKACKEHDMDPWKHVHGCLNDMDPVTLLEYRDLEEDEYDDIIKLGSGNCYHWDTLYNMYKAAVQSTEDGHPYAIKDPLNLDYALTADDLDKIRSTMEYKNIPMPKHKQWPQPPAGYNIEVSQQWYYNNEFYPIFLVGPQGRRVIGTIPIIDENYVPIQKLYDVWNRGMLMPHPNGPTGITILDQTATTANVAAGSNNYYWWNGRANEHYQQPLSIPEMREVIESKMANLINELDNRIS